MDKETGSLKVGGFKKNNLQTLAPVLADPSTGEPYGENQDGYMAVAPADREILEVVLEEMIDVIRADIEGAQAVKLRISKGKPGYVGLTATARQKLGGLVKYEEQSGNKVEGESVTLKRVGTQIEIRKIVG